METYMQMLGRLAKNASRDAAKLGTKAKNRGLLAVANELVEERKLILQENAKDIEAAKAKGVKQSLIDRLALTEQRIEDMAEGLRQIAALDDPIGEVLGMKTRPNGLRIGKKRVPLGVVGIIYEARPNVTADAFGLCFKTGNVVILKGGSDAIHSNEAIVKCIRETLKANDITENAIQLIQDTSRETAAEFMKMNEYVDVLIPRGGAGLIQAVVKNATVPVIETGVGNCHIYIDKDANVDMAADIVYNAKTNRVSVCNAAESLLIHKDIAKEALPKIKAKLDEKSVELFGDEEAVDIAKGIEKATERDWGTEYLDYKMSVKIVNSLDEAVDHIYKYSTGHSECIVTENKEAAEEFLNKVDSAAVYVNASTRFTDGGEFGFGAEIGISTQKLHARGPIGLPELQSFKYKIYGNGQVR